MRRLRGRIDLDDNGTDNGIDDDNDNNDNNNNDAFIALRDRLADELERAGRYTRDPKPSAIWKWFFGIFGTLVLYLISILLVNLEFKKQKWSKNLFSQNYGEGLGASTVITVTLFICRYSYDRGFGDIAYCCRHRGHARRMWTNFLKQLCLTLLFGWVAGFPTTALTPVFKGV